MQALICGLAGETLDPAERAFIQETDPAGVILFARNCSTRSQLRALTDDLREASSRADFPILIDQEGGRVARLAAPEWPLFPAAARFGTLYQKAPISAIEAARTNALAIAVTLAEAGVNFACLPVLDLAHDDGHDIVGDRAFGGEPMQVAALGRAVLDGLAAGGVCGIVKHMPGHGRARCDSHLETPRVDADDAALADDLEPFMSLRDAPAAMTAHIIYSHWDADRVTTQSPTVMEQVIRGRIGFDGLLISDDLEMAALSGPLADRARDAIGAGCDLVLIGSGRLSDSEAVAAGAGTIAPAAAARLERALQAIAGRSSDEDCDTLAARRDALLALA